MTDMGFYRKKPAIIEAFRWTKISDQKKKPQWFIEAIEKGVIFTGGTYTGDGKFCEPILIIHTLEGNNEVHFGDWIIKGVMGEIYSCKPGIFEMTYDPVGPDTE